MGRFVVCGSSSSTLQAYILSSSDGVTWRYEYGPKPNAYVSAIAYGNGTFVATWRTNNNNITGFLVSTNLSSWRHVPIPSGNQLTDLAAFGGGQFIASLGGKTYTSPDGISWTNRAAVSNATAFTYGQGTFVAASPLPSLLQSGVFGSSTSAVPSNLALSLYPGMTLTGTEGNVYRIEYATNAAPGATWLPLTTLTLPYSPYLWFDTTAATQSQRFYRTVLIQ